MSVYKIHQNLKKLGDDWGVAKQKLASVMAESYMASDTLLRFPLTVLYTQQVEDKDLLTLYEHLYFDITGRIIHDVFPNTKSLFASMLSETDYDSAEMVILTELLEMDSPKVLKIVSDIGPHYFCGYLRNAARKLEYQNREKVYI